MPVIGVVVGCDLPEGLATYLPICQLRKQQILFVIEENLHTITETPA